jgi:hypothetical protein
MDVNKTLMLTGEAIKGQLVQSINELVSPPLGCSPLLNARDLTNP